ncbi:guanylate kinase [Facklamia hominis]
MTKQRGLLVILSGPSGVGKGTIRAAVFKQEDCEYVYSVSATTRSARPGEIDGKDYFFVKREEFESLIANQALLEYAEYVGNYYGTPLDNIEKNLAEGYDVFLEIEVQGASKVRQRMPEGIFIFLAPPSLNELETRLVDRGTDSKEKIAQRMKQAKREIEMMAEYDYVVVNDQVDNAVRKINAIIECEHLRVSRVIDKIQIGMDQYLNNKGE